jgi:hypothetical protein
MIFNLYAYELQWVTARFGACLLGQGKDPAGASHGAVHGGQLSSPLGTSGTCSFSFCYHVFIVTCRIPEGPSISLDLCSSSDLIILVVTF